MKTDGRDLWRNVDRDPRRRRDSYPESEGKSHRCTSSKTKWLEARSNLSA